MFTRKLGVAALAAGLLTASCTGHNGSAGGFVPNAPAPGVNDASTAGMKPGATRVRSFQTIASGRTKFGTHGTRKLGITTVPLGWAATGTGAPVYNNATDLGAVPASKSMTVYVGLQLHNVDALKNLVASGQTISSATFAGTYAPSSADASAVASYLQKQGFTNVTTSPNRIMVGGTGTAAQVEKAFNTRIHSMTVNGVSSFSNVVPAYVPASLSGVAIAVLGLNNVQSAKAAPKKGGAPSPKPSPTPIGTTESDCTMYGLEVLGFPTGPAPEPGSDTTGCLRNYRPADYWRAYHAGTSQPASHVNVAIMTAGNLEYTVADLRTNESADNIPQVPVYIKSVGVPGAAVSGGPAEFTLDSTASSGMAGTLKALYIYNTTSLTDSDIALMYNKWVTDDYTRIANSSFGGCEAFPFVDGSMLIDDEILLQGASQGQTMFASTGDTGSFCPVLVGENGVPAGAPMVQYPAASPYVVAVGGTTLVTDNAGAYQGETAWYAGGGGLSAVEYQPAWMSAQPVGGWRGVPDVSMDGDLQTGMVLYSQDFQGWGVIGGTSLASPLMAGVWARMLQTHNYTLGYASVRLYNMFTKSSAGAAVTGPPPWEPYGGFHDILVGGNGLYTAQPGYDMTTGLGSIDIQATNAIIAN